MAASSQLVVREAGVTKSSNLPGATLNPKWLMQMKSSKEDALDYSEWRGLIRGTGRMMVMTAGFMCLTVSGTGSSRLSWIKEL